VQLVGVVYIKTWLNTIMPAQLHRGFPLIASYGILPDKVILSTSTCISRCKKQGKEVSDCKTSSSLLVSLRNESTTCEFSQAMHKTRRNDYARNPIH
jgi:hypothetical protein